MDAFIHLHRPVGKLGRVDPNQCQYELTTWVSGSHPWYLGSAMCDVQDFGDCGDED
jgi:hypothetical protein